MPIIFGSTSSSKRSVHHKHWQPSRRGVFQQMSRRLTCMCGKRQSPHGRERERAELKPCATRAPRLLGIAAVTALVYSFIYTVPQNRMETKCIRCASYAVRAVVPHEPLGLHPMFRRDFDEILHKIRVESNRSRALIYRGEGGGGVLMKCMAVVVRS